MEVQWTPLAETVISSLPKLVPDYSPISYTLSWTFLRDKLIEMFHCVCKSRTWILWVFSRDCDFLLA